MGRLRYACCVPLDAAGTFLAAPPVPTLILLTRCAHGVAWRTLAATACHGPAPRLPPHFLLAHLCVRPTGALARSHAPGRMFHWPSRLRRIPLSACAGAMSLPPFVRPLMGVRIIAVLSTGADS
jgi:hypothetical protein